MSRFEPINYKGPERVYKPVIGETVEDTPAFYSSGDISRGYADIDYLKEQLGRILAASTAIYNECVNQLQDFALLVDTENTDLVMSHNAVYPAGTAPAAITFDEYRYLIADAGSNSSQYVISAYENAVRGSAGTNALDVFHMVRSTSNEANRIMDFLEAYIGEVDDTSEFRVLEAFQNWAADAVQSLHRFWQVVRGENSQSLPSDEIAMLDKTSASQTQAMFQVKINTINMAIKDIISQMYKNWENSSDIFYAKHLGPALGFQLNVGRTLPTIMDNAKMPIISNEVAGTLSGLNSNFARANADQLKRNRLYVDYSEQILSNVVHRDTYSRYIRQLSQIGSGMKQLFTSADSVEQVPEVIKTPSTLKSYNQIRSPQANFDTGHGSLSGIEDADAHPQYLYLGGGSTITGDTAMAPDAKIGGIVPSRHRHNGSDGSARIRGSDIEYNSITDLQIANVDPTTEVPVDLEVTSQVPFETMTGDFKVSSEVTFTLDSTANIAGYEFEIVKLD